jgi:hypothetical protein
MKRLFFATVLSTLVAIPALAEYQVGDLSITRFPGYYTGNGGEFTIFSYDTSLLTNLAYSDLTKDKGTVTPSFQTFCVERTEVITSPVHAEVSTTFIDEINGGNPVEGSHAITGGAGKPYGDNLDPRTAYLYTQFATGVLSNYDYDPLGSRSTSAGDLQYAIWYLEQEMPAWWSPTGQTLAWIDEAAAAVAKGTWSGIGKARILNLYTGSGTGRVEKQSQLYLLPVPAAVLLGLLGLGVAGFRLRRSM